MTSPPESALAAGALAQGWTVMAGLIVAIGAQNALVLQQGLQRRHLGPVVTLCVLSDWALSAAGVYGFGAALATSPAWTQSLRMAGAAFLGAYAARSMWRAFAGGRSGLAANRAAAATLPATLAAAAAMTWLNPHVYLDTVVLLGSLGAARPAVERGPFFVGAATASLMWFVALGYGAAALSPWLQRPIVWRIVDAAMALLMGALAIQLAFR